METFLLVLGVVAFLVVVAVVSGYAWGWLEKRQGRAATHPFHVLDQEVAPDPAVCPTCGPVIPETETKALAEGLSITVVFCDSCGTTLHTDAG